MNERGESLIRLRQQLYTIAFLIAMAGSVFALVIGETIGSSNTFTRGILIVVIIFEGLAIVLIRHRRFIRLTEELTYILFSAALASTLWFSLYADATSVLLRSSLLSYYMWVPAVYVLIFFLYSGRGALIRSSGLFLLLLFISMPYILASTKSTNLFEGFNTLAHHFVSTAAIITLLYFFTRVRERLAAAQATVTKVTELSETDALTGVPNRRRVCHVLDLEMDRSRRYGGPLSVILFDIDDFKKVNDSLGHDAGDAVLIEFARIIDQCRRTSDLLGRWGGEEFVFIAPATDEEGAAQLGERLRTAVEQHYFAPVGKITASFGAAVFRDEDDMDALIKRADANLYEAKRRGKNRVRV